MYPPLSLGLLACLSGLPSGQSTTSASDSISHVRLSVAGANDEWTPTGVAASAGDYLIVQAGGKVKVGQIAGEVDPDGVSGNRSGAGTLMIKIGATQVKAVGSGALIIASEAGDVKFRIQDNRYEDNAGSFAVDLILLPSSMVPAARSAGPPITGAGLPPSDQILVASMRSDLRNLVTAEEAFFADSVKYTTKIGPGGLTYSVTGSNSLPRIALTADGWRAVMSNPNTRIVCAIFIGQTPEPPATKEGEPLCR